MALVGLHPAAAECVGWFACQPILLAALASLLAVGALLRLRDGATVGRRAVFAAGTGALFSYEAAVGVPLLLVGLDCLWPKDGGPPRPSDRWACSALLAAYPPYVGVALWNRAGTTLTDASYRAGAGEALTNVRVDLANYLVKVLPMPPYGADTYAAIGSWMGTALVAAFVAGWLARFAPSRAAWRSSSRTRSCCAIGLRGHARAFAADAGGDERTEIPELSPALPAAGGRRGGASLRDEADEAR